MVQPLYISVKPSLRHSLYGQQYRKKAVENWDGTGELVGFGRKAACFLVAIFYDQRIVAWVQYFGSILSLVKILSMKNSERVITSNVKYFLEDGNLSQKSKKKKIAPNSTDV